MGGDVLVIVWSILGIALVVMVFVLVNRVWFQCCGQDTVAAAIAILAAIAIAVSFAVAVGVSDTTA